MMHKVIDTSHGKVLIDANCGEITISKYDEPVLSDYDKALLELKEIVRIVGLTPVYSHTDIDELKAVYEAYGEFGSILALNAVYTAGYIKGVRTERKRRRKV